jgi:tripartite-type tricarboxylate transporter receptor subunit TctC
VASCAPDGYTLVIVSIGHAVNPALYGKLPFDPVKDFAPVVLIATAPNMLVVHPSVPAATVRELIAYARSNPGKLNVASSGGGTSVHLAAELFQSLTGTKFVHVPYKGAAPAMPDLLSGQVDLMFPNMPSALPHVKSGKLRALGVTSASRSAGAPDVPAICETVPGYVVTTWYGLLAPAGTPAAVVAKINADVRAVLEQPVFRSKLVVQGADPAGGTPEEFAEFLRVETVKWGKVVREAGIKLE